MRTDLGIEHTQRLLTKSPEVTTNTIQHYKMLLRVIFDNEPLIPQTSQDIISRRPVTTLTPNFLCLQCPTTCTIRERSLHGQMRAHMFCKMGQKLRHHHSLIALDVDSQSGGLFCQMCDDFIWDPTLEELRLRKIGTGSFSSQYLWWSRSS